MNFFDIVIVLLLAKILWATNGYLFENRFPASETNHQVPRSVPQQQQQYQQESPVPNIDRIDYFFFSAPEETDEETDALKSILSSIKKRQEIIFIKNPVNDDIEAALEKVIQNSVQQRAHIYLFGKEPSYADLAQQHQNIQETAQPKPQDHFLKYRDQSIQPVATDQYEVAKNNKVLGKNFPTNFLPTDVDLVSKCSYMPLASK